MASHYAILEVYVAVSFTPFSPVYPLFSFFTAKLTLKNFIWIDFMRVALQDIPDEPPTMPANILTMRIDAATGQLANAQSEKTIFEIFRAEHAPGSNRLQLPKDLDDLTTPAQRQPVVKTPSSPPAAEDLF